MGCGYKNFYVLARNAPPRPCAPVPGCADPGPLAAAEDYQFPGHAADPDVTFRDSAAAIRYAAGRPVEEQRFYFRNAAAGEPALATAFFTRDGGMVLGVSALPATRSDTGGSQVAGWLDWLRAATGAGSGTPCTSHPRRARRLGSSSSSGRGPAPKLVGGQLILPTCEEECGVVWLDWRRCPLGAMPTAWRRHVNVGGLRPGSETNGPVPVEGEDTPTPSGRDGTGCSQIRIVGE